MLDIFLICCKNNAFWKQMQTFDNDVVFTFWWTGFRPLPAERLEVEPTPNCGALRSTALRSARNTTHWNQQQSISDLIIFQKMFGNIIYFVLPLRQINISNT